MVNHAPKLFPGHEHASRLPEFTLIIFLIWQLDTGQCQAISFELYLREIIKLPLYFSLLFIMEARARIGWGLARFPRRWCL